MPEMQVRWVRLRTQFTAQVRQAWTMLPGRLGAWRTRLASLRTSAGWQAVWRAAWPFLAYAVAWVLALYVASALAFALSPKVEGPVPLYLTGPVTVAALFLAPRRHWWRYLVLTFPLILVAFWLLRLPLSLAVWWVIVFVYLIIVSISVVTVSVFQRVAVLPPRFANVAEVGRFVVSVAAGALAGMLIASTARTIVFSWDFWISWQMGYLGYVLGIVTFTPAIVLWLTDGPGGLGLSTPRRQVEFTLLSLATVLVGGLIFGTSITDLTIAHTLIYLQVPLLIWAAIRFGPQGLASALTLTTALAITGAVNNRGPFVGPSATDNTLALQLFLLFVGVPLYFLAALVREREQADAARRASEERYHSVVEAQTELVTRYRPDTTITFVNEANCRYLGKSREELIGTRLLDHIPATAHEQVQATIHSLLEHPGVATIEHEAILPDGSLGWQQWVDRTICDAEGRVIELQGIGRDITERKQAEDALQASEARYRATFDSAAIGVAVVDLEGRPLEVNEYISQMVGYTPDELRTMALRDFTHPDDVAANEALLGRALTGAIGSYQLEKRYRHKDGYIVWGRLSASLVRDRDGQPAYFVVHLEDVSQRKQLEHDRDEQAEQLDRVIEQMAEGVAVYDTQGRIVRVNAAQRRLEGLGAEDAALPLAAYAQLPLPDRMALFEARDEQGRPLTPEEGPLPRALRGEGLREPETMDIRSRTLDGREVELSVSAATLRDRDGRPAGAVAVFRDQTERRQLERERDEQATQLDRIFEQMTEALVVHDAEGRVVRANAALRRLVAPDDVPPEYGEAQLGERVALYSMRDMQGRPLAPEETPNMRALRGEDLTGEHAVDVRLRTLDGREVEFRVSAAPLRDRDGHIVGAVSLGVDVTERNQLARALAEQAEQLDRIIEGMGDGVFVYDAEGRIVRTNPAARHLLGLDHAPPEYFQLPAEDRIALYTPREGQEQPSDRATPVEWLVTRMLQGSGDPFTATEVRDLRMRALDGRELEVSASVAPLRDRKNLVVGAVLMLRDQTERNQLAREREEALLRSEAWFHTMADTAPAMLWVVDTEGLATFVNARWLAFTGRTLEQELGTGWTENIHPDDSPRSLETYLTAVRTRQPFTMEYRVRRFDGAYRWVVDSGVPRFAPDGSFTGFIGSVIDITDREELRQKQEEARARALALQELNERLDTFVAMAAHDLRHPVGVSKMAVEGAQRRVRQAAAAVHGGSSKQIVPFVQVETALDTIARNLDGLWRLMQQLLDVTRARQGTLELDRRPADLAVLVRQAIDEQRLLSPTRTITLDQPESADANGDGEPIVVEVDVDRLGQVLANYLSNAVRYSPDDQPIEVVVRRVAGSGPGEDAGAAGAKGGEGGAGLARVEVRDCGPGIPPEDQATIWDRFQRARTVGEALGGLGLGLYIARLLVEQHGGQVGVESMVGQGSTFWFTVPLAPNMAPATDTAAPTALPVDGVSEGAGGVDAGRENRDGDVAAP